MKLLSDSDKMKDSAVALLEDFLAKGPFSFDISAKSALGKIEEYKKKLKQLRELEAQLRKDLGVFDISILESAEMQMLEKVLQINFYNCFFLIYSLKYSNECVYEHYIKKKLSFRTSWSHKCQSYTYSIKTLFHKTS